MLGDSTGTTGTPDNSIGVEDAADGSATNQESEVNTGGTNQDTRIQLTTKQLKDRLVRAEGQVQKNFFSELGVSDLTDAKAKLARLAELEKSQLSEQERLTQERDAAVKEADIAKRKAEKLVREKKDQEAMSFLTSIASKNGVETDAMELAVRRLEKYVEENFDGEDDITESSLAPFFKQLRGEKKLWFAVKETTASSGAKDNMPPASNTAGGTGRRTPSKPVEQMTSAELKAYKQSLGLRV